MKVLVTGGAGYIGSHTIVELLSSGFDVLSADNYSNSTAKVFDRIEKITGRRVKNYCIDLTDHEKTASLFYENPDIKSILHFAALKAVGDSEVEPLRYFHNNCYSLVNLLECCMKYNIPYFVFSSSCTIYGTVEKLPVSEYTPVQKPRSHYGFTKLVGERLIEDFFKTQSQFNAVILRYFNPVGAHPSGLLGELPFGKPNNLVPIITQFTAGILPEMTVFGNDYPTRDGTCIRDYVHVCDIARAHLDALNYTLKKEKSMNTEIFNLGTGSGVSVLEIIKVFEKITGKKVNYSMGARRPGDVPAIYSDSSKANKILGWKPTYDIAAMMESAWKWQMELNGIATK